MKILVIEPDTTDLDNLLLCLNLAWSAEDIVSCSNFFEGYDLIQNEAPDIVLLSLDTADGKGLTILQQIRTVSAVPVIVLSSSQRDYDQAQALEIGADDYISKPIVFIDVISRIKALYRRANYSGENASIYSGNNLQISYHTHQVTVSGKQVKLSPTEYNLLCTLIRNKGRVVSHSYLLERALGPEYKNDTSELKVWMYRLRSKIQNGKDAKLIVKNQRGVGYFFEDA